MLTNCVISFIIILVRQGNKPFMEGSEVMDEMTSAELNKYLEAIAELIEAKANEPETHYDRETLKAAAQVVRNKKIDA